MAASARVEGDDVVDVHSKTSLCWMRTMAHPCRTALIPCVEYQNQSTCVYDRAHEKHQHHCMSMSVVSNV